MNIILSCAYYNKLLNLKTHVPAYGPSGLNAGVLFMRLNKLREFDFEKKILNLIPIYKSRLQFAEQDLINILFHNDTGGIIKLLKFEIKTYSK